MKPITPQECSAQAGSHIPELVVESVNALLKKKYSGGRATFTQDEVIAEIQKRGDTISREQIFDSKWLDFEPLFRRAGWDVEFDKPGYCETYDANWKFTKKKPRDDE